MFDIRLRLTANNIEQMEVDDSEFGIADNYKMVSYKYIKVEIEKLRSAKNAEAEQTIKELERRLKDENDKYQRLQGEVKRAQELSTVNRR